MRLHGGARTLLTLARFALCVAMAASAQSQEGPSPKQTAPNGAPKTLVGCLTGYDGHYTLGTSSDTLYLLEGDSALFKRYNARMVRATGTVSEPPPGPSKNNVLSQQPPTLTVSKLKKVADGCN
jgi:hypothetical protein